MIDSRMRFAQDLIGHLSQKNLSSNYEPTNQLLTVSGIESPFRILGEFEPQPSEWTTFLFKIIYGFLFGK